MNFIASLKSNYYCKKWEKSLAFSQKRYIFAADLKNTSYE